jgi:membrane protein DedA with SNARE-associated domain
MNALASADYLAGEGLWVLYAALFAAAFLKYVAPFVPGDLITLVALFYIGMRDGSWTIGVAAITLGGTLGAFAAFAWGAKAGAFLAARSPRLKKLQGRVERALLKWGVWPLVLNRFVPYIRPLLFPTAGALKMKPVPVVVSAFFGNVLFAFFLVGLAYTAGHRFSHLENLYRLYQLWIGLAVFMLLAALAIAFWRASRRNGGKESEGAAP